MTTTRQSERQHRHASVASLHIDDDCSHHQLTSAKILGLLVTWEFNIFEMFDLVGPNTFVIVGDGIIQHLHSFVDCVANIVTQSTCFKLTFTFHLLVNAK